MRYFKDTKGDVYGYDETVESQLPYIQKAIDEGWKEITGAWPPSESKAQTQVRLEAVLGSAINDAAMQWGYNSIEAAISYVTSTNPQYVAEARALSRWRDEVWAWGIPALDAVTPGETPGEFLADMPLPPPRPIV
jgi:hypothetical protein